MTIDITKDRDKTVCALKGYADTPACAELERVLREAAGEAEKLELDLAETVYVSSSALRVFLAIHRIMRAKGGLSLTRVDPMIMRILDVTGLSSVLTIE